MNQVYWNNTAAAWLIAAGTTLICLILIRLFRFLIIKRVKTWSLSTNTTWDDFLITMVERSVVPALYVSAFYFVLISLKLPPKLLRIIHIGYLAALTFFMLRVLTAGFRR